MKQTNVMFTPVLDGINKGDLNVTVETMHVVISDVVLQ
jgi:hypothetical protein